MKNNNTFALHILQRFSVSWWGLPLLLPLVLLPLSAYLSVQLLLPDGYVYLIFLPLAMMIALLMTFSWAALPGITLALLCRYVPLHGGFYALLTVSCFIASLALCWWGYCAQTGRRWGVSLGELRLSYVRLFWLALALPSVLLILLQLMVSLHILPAHMSVFGREFFSLRNLINYLSALTASVTATQIYYCIVRTMKSPRFFIRLLRRLKLQIAPGVTLREIGVWVLVVGGVVLFLTQRSMATENLLLTDYTLTMLLPAMLWSAMRFGYIFTAISWALMLQLLYQFREHFQMLPVPPEHMAVVASNMLVFTVTLYLIAAVCTRQRRLHVYARKAALSDPIIGLPNLRALTQDMNTRPVSLLCFLRIPELDLLGRTYGLQLRIQYKRGLAEWLQPVLLPGEGVYQLPGFDLVLRLNHEGLQLRMETIEVRLRNYRLTWDGLPQHPRIGISFCTVRTPVPQLYELLGELSEVAEMSLQSGRAENLILCHALPVKRDIEDKIRLLHDVQLALRQDRFTLFAQKIQGVRGDHYHEVLVRLCDEKGEDITPDRFLPVVQEFGLTWELDNWVLDHTLSFMDAQREALAGARFSVNMFASSLCRPRFAHELAEKLTLWNVEPWQLIVEVAESQVLSDFSWGNRTLAQLREMGCRVAIDDYGTAYSSYTRLRELNVDIVKIEGSFVKNMLNNSLDYQIIEAICCLARLKKMQVVAKHVESSEIALTLKKMGVDYLQGFAIGLPHPINGCVE